MNGDTVTLSLEAAAGGSNETFEADVVLVSTGRRPFTQNIGLKEMGIETDRLGRVVVSSLSVFAHPSDEYHHLRFPPLGQTTTLDINPLFSNVIFVYCPSLGE